VAPVAATLTLFAAVGKLSPVLMAKAKTTTQLIFFISVHPKHSFARESTIGLV
jgi:hypothetical protein